MAIEGAAAEHEFLVRVLKIFSDADAHNDLLWWVRDDGPHMYANVSDVFAWGGADAEDITPDTLPVLEQALADLKAIRQEHLVGELYAARIRKMRPQGAAYPAEAAAQALFNACGPERELGIGNPKQIPPARETA
jgi:hypothetical protein